MIMQPDIKILPIAKPMIGAMWPHVLPHLRKGLGAATDVDVPELLISIVKGDVTVWAVFEGMEVVAAFVTDVRNGNESFFLNVYALGGSGLTQWAGMLGDEMASKAKALGARSVRFVGKRGYEKLLPTFKVIGETHGQQVYERAVT